MLSSLVTSQILIWIRLSSIVRRLDSYGRWHLTLMNWYGFLLFLQLNAAKRRDFGSNLPRQQIKNYHEVDALKLDGDCVDGHLGMWKANKRQFFAKPLTYTPLAGGPQILFMASSMNYIRTLNAETSVIINSRQVHTPFLQSDIGCTGIFSFVVVEILLLTRYRYPKLHWYHRNASY